MLKKTRGVVLHSIKYGDSSLIIHLYTLDSGRRSFIIKGVRTRKSRYKTNLFSVLNILQVEYYDKEGKDLIIIKEASRAKVFNSIPFNMSKSSQTLFIAEFLNRCLIEQSPDKATYEFLENAIEYFDLMKNDYASFHLSFLLKFTRYLGILPLFEENEEKMSYNTIKGNFNNSLPAHFQFIEKEKARMLHRLFTEDFEKGSKIPLSREKRNILLNEILKFYSLNGFKVDSLNTVKVLKELFSEE